MVIVFTCFSNHVIKVGKHYMNECDYINPKKK